MMWCRGGGGLGVGGIRGGKGERQTKTERRCMKMRVDGGKHIEGWGLTIV